MGKTKVSNLKEHGTSFAAYIGLDWADKKHYFSMQTADGKRSRGELQHTPEAIDAWAGELARRLKRLPPGHPSSPFEADGTPRPPEPGLRSREVLDERPAGATDSRPLGDALCLPRGRSASGGVPALSPGQG